MVTFFAPIDETSDSTAKQEICYDYFGMEDELSMLQNEHYQDYCMKQCLKICYYLQKVRQIEVLQMKAEFLKDENNNIWLSYIKEIHIRRIKAKFTLNNCDTKGTSGNDSMKTH